VHDTERLLHQLAAHRHARRGLETRELER
jgi:hypothetical protein